MLRTIVVVLAFAVISFPSQGQSQDPILISALTQPTLATVGSYCVQDSDCLGGGLICKMAVSNCTFGECACPGDNAFDSVDLTCKNATGLGLPCNVNVTCRELFSQCTNGVCACADGYKLKRSPDGIMYICSPTNAVTKFGAACFESSDCMAPLICSTNHVCSCDIGFSYTGNPKRLCAPKSVNDSCTSDDECLIANAYCTGGTCQCAGGYTNINWRVQFREPLTGTYSAWTISACVGAVEITYASGSQCLTALRRSGSAACDPNSICIPCNPNVNNTGYCVGLIQQVGRIGGYTGIAHPIGST